jgi:serine phosphatase RsbU (regulator of sigma subunit)
LTLVSKSTWKLLKRWTSQHWPVKSISGQLALGLTIKLLPCLALGFYATQEFVRNRINGLAQERLSSEAELISYGLRQWGKGTARVVEALTLNPSFTAGRVDEIQTVLKAISSEHPEHTWRFWSASQPPQLLAYNGELTPQRKAEAERKQPQREYYQAALRGYSTYQVIVSNTTGRACLIISKPVFRSSLTRDRTMLDVGLLRDGKELERKPILTDVSGVLLTCLPLAGLGSETGLVELFGSERLSPLADNKKGDFLYDKNGFESAVILVSNSGQLLFPDTSWRPDRIPSIHDLANTAIPSLLPIAKQAMSGDEIFTTITDHGHRYFALTARVDSAWSLILLLNERTAKAEVAAISRAQALVALLTLLTLLCIIIYQSRFISQPISLAGRALKQISSGNFDIEVNAISNDEIGGLLSNLQITANRLKSYLESVTSFAVTQKQIDTAKLIQKDFLLARLPSSSCYEVEALSRPALDIGADWYDMVDTSSHVIFVVADVCDKGIPSALYMSVFRSLIRSRLFQGLDDVNSSDDASQIIVDAISQTNNYMAANQNSSMMFATVFIAAISKNTGILSYVCAGHESPVLLSDEGTIQLEGISGPAIGLFSGAHYEVFSLKLQPGAALIVYSDGLIDARNHSNESWGLGRMHELLPTLRGSSASQLMIGIINDVEDHMDSFEQFDDLTVMVLRWLGAREKAEALSMGDEKPGKP